MIIDESRLYGDDHPERCMEYVQAFFEQTAYPFVRSVYALGSVVTGDYMLGLSDLDILVLTDREDLSLLMNNLRQLNDQLWIVSFHLLKPDDFPPPDLFFQVRLRAESTLLYGTDVVSKLEPGTYATLCEQVRIEINRQLMRLRTFICSPTIAKQNIATLVYHTQKACVTGLRGLMVVQGMQQDTSRSAIIAWLHTSGNVLSPHSRDIANQMMSALDARGNVQQQVERVGFVLNACILLEEVYTLCPKP